MLITYPVCRCENTLANVRFRYQRHHHNDDVIHDRKGVKEEVT